MNEQELLDKYFEKPFFFSKIRKCKILKKFRFHIKNGIEYYYIDNIWGITAWESFHKELKSLYELKESFRERNDVSKLDWSFIPKKPLNTMDQLIHDADEFDKALEERIPGIIKRDKK